MTASALRPNIILILADDMGYGDIGAFGNEVVQTPALDQLVAQGVMLTQHYSASAVCAPARAGLLTGRYPHRTGAIDTLEGRGLDRLALRETTMADLLGAAGYSTGLIGKWHLGAFDPRYHPMARGFAETVCFHGGWQDYWQWHLDYNGRLDKGDGRYLTDVFTDEALAFIGRHKHEPFFLHLTYNAPHFPLQAPAEDAEVFRQRGDLHEAVSVLYGMNRRMDQGVGHIMEALTRYGLDDNTLLLFTSDNGPQFGSREHGPGSLKRFNGHFAGSKGTVYEGGIRVPAILRWPSGVTGGQQLDGLVHFNDWLPTLLAMAGVEMPAGRIDGYNVAALLQHENSQTESRRFWQWNRYTPIQGCNAAMRDGPWKLVYPAIDEAMQVSADDLRLDYQLKYEPTPSHSIDQHPEPPRQVPAPHPPLLFDLGADPYERHNLAAVHPERVYTMQRALETWFEEVESERRSIRE